MKRHHVLLLVTFCLSLVQSAFAQTPTATASALPRLVRFGGVIKDANGNPQSGVAGITFALYAEQTGGAPLWQETQNVTADSSGHYTALLGATKTEGLPAELFTGEQAHWVGMQVQGQPEQPRVLLVSAPYALKAGDAETIGGLPPSAFVLAAPLATGPAAASGPATSAAESNAMPATATDVTTTGGTVGYLPLFNAATTVVDSAVYQSGTGATVRVGVAGALSLPATGTATSSPGFNSEPLDLVASAYNTGAGEASAQTFQLQAEPVGSGTATTSGVLSLLYGSGTSTPAETGLQIASNGVITFAPGQTLPAVTGNITATGEVQGSVVNAATSLDINGIPVMQAQAGSGNLGVGVGTIPPSSSASENTAFGDYALGRLGANGNASENTAVGYYALYNNQNGGQNTATGNLALYVNGEFTTGGNNNTANGFQALENNTTGSNNTGVGYCAGAVGTFCSTGNPNITGSSNTFIGSQAGLSTTSVVNNATAIGANAAVGASNALVLGSINGVNGATASTKVGVGTSTPGSTLELSLPNIGGLGPSLTLTNTGSMAGSASLDFNTDTPSYSPSSGSYNPTARILATDDGHFSSGLTFLSNIPGGLNNGLQTNMAITSTGLVGIGTPAPGATLEVNGTAKFDGLVTFAPGQPFPGGAGVTSITAGTGLTTGTGPNPITTSGTLSIAPNACPKHEALTALPFTTTSASCSYFAGLGENTFQAGQTIDGQLTVTGTGDFPGQINASTSSSAYPAVYGTNTSTSGGGPGVSGSSASPSGTGVLGANTAGGYAGYFQGNVGVSGGLTATTTAATTSAVGNAVSGSNTATSGKSNGGSFSTSSAAGTGVVGVNYAGGYAGYFQGNVEVTGNQTVGGTLNAGYVNVSGSYGAEVEGINTATSGGVSGVSGSAMTPDGSGVYGFNGSTGGSGVKGVAVGGSNTGSALQSFVSAGVWGDTNQAGFNSNNAQQANAGVLATSDFGPALYAASGLGASESPLITAAISNYALTAENWSWDLWLGGPPYSGDCNFENIGNLICTGSISTDVIGAGKRIVTLHTVQAPEHRLRTSVRASWPTVPPPSPLIPVMHKPSTQMWNTTSF